MSDPKKSTERIRVHLLRPGVGAEDYQLSKGATLADLLGRSGATTKNQAVFLDGVLAEESAPLQNGSIVTIAPRPRNARSLYETYKPRPAKQAGPGFIDWRDLSHRGCPAVSRHHWRLNWSPIVTALTSCSCTRASSSSSRGNRS